MMPREVADLHQERERKLAGILSVITVVAKGILPETVLAEEDLDLETIEEEVMIEEVDLIQEAEEDGMIDAEMTEMTEEGEDQEVQMIVIEEMIQEVITEIEKTEEIKMREEEREEILEMMLVDLILQDIRKIEMTIEKAETDQEAEEEIEMAKKTTTQEMEETTTETTLEETNQTS